MATHSSIHAWRILWTEEPGRLQSMGSQSWTQLSDYYTHTHRESIIMAIELSGQWLSAKVSALAGLVWGQ